jgi:hypothetical protein
MGQETRQEMREETREEMRQEMGQEMRQDADDIETTPDFPKSGPTSG